MELWIFCRMWHFLPDHNGKRWSDDLYCSIHSAHRRHSSHHCNIGERWNNIQPRGGNSYRLSGDHRQDHTVTLILKCRQSGYSHGDGDWGLNQCWSGLDGDVWQQQRKRVRQFCFLSHRQCQFDNVHRANGATSSQPGDDYRHLACL